MTDRSSIRLYLKWAVMLLVVIVAMICLHQVTYNKNLTETLGTRHNIPGPTPHLNRTQTYACPRDILAAKNKPVCTFSLLKQIFLDTGHFPKCIRWDKKENLVPGQCEFGRRKDMSLGYCLVRKNVKRIVLLGDSNINQLYDILIGRTKPCKRIRKEKQAGGKPEVGYYSQDTRGHITQHKECTGCLGKKNMCKLGGKDLLIEYIPMEYLWDVEISTERVPGLCTVKGLPFDRPCPEARSTQQFMFKQYFQQTGYPDVILHFLTNHDKDLLTAGEDLLAAEMMGRIYELYVPKSSRVVIFSKWKQATERFPDKGLFEKKYNSVQQIIRQNKACAEGVTRAVRENKNIDVFFDMNTHGTGLPLKWATDRSHYNHKYYGKILEQFQALFCV